MWGQILLALILGTEIVRAGYTLNATFSGTTFFENFQFYTDDDPTDGYVNYVNYSVAEKMSLISTAGDQIYIGVDYTYPATGRGRDSVRLQSNLAWNSGLFIMDLAHMPYGCGTWPAWWLVGPNWPYSGEIDIIEGVNANVYDTTTLHTSEGCVMKESNFTGTWGMFNATKPSTNCVNNGYYYGCSILAESGSYGSPFNKAGGGVYAAEWTESYIRAYFFPRGSIPKDLPTDSPNPDSWGMPYAYFELGEDCNPDHFKNMSMIFDLTFCGQWAGAVFDSQCPGLGTCESYVQENPSDFEEAYWLINNVTVFQR